MNELSKEEKLLENKFDGSYLNRGLDRVALIEGNYLLNLCKSENINIKGIKLFLQRGADVNSKSFDDDTPLHYALTNKNATLEIIKCLVENGSDLYCKNNFGYTPAHNAYSSNEDWELDNEINNYLNEIMK